MAMLHMIEGPVGAGKTTYANRLGKDLKTAPLVLDDWMATLFRPDRPEGEIWEWYGERKRRCVEQIWQVARRHVELGGNAIVELGLIQRAQRLAFYERAETANVRLRVHVLDADPVERLRRVRARNVEMGETFAMAVSDDVFAMASAMWESVDTAEQQGRDIVFV